MLKLRQQQIVLQLEQVLTVPVALAWQPLVTHCSFIICRALFPELLGRKYTPQGGRGDQFEQTDGVFSRCKRVGLVCFSFNGNMVLAFGATDDKSMNSIDGQSLLDTEPIDKSKHIEKSLS